MKKQSKMRWNRGAQTTLKAVCSEVPRKAASGSKVNVELAMSQKADEDQPASSLFCTEFGDAASSMFKSVRPTTQKLVEQRLEAVEDSSVTASGVTSSPKVRAPTTIAWKTTRRKW